MFNFNFVTVCRRLAIFELSEFHELYKKRILNKKRKKEQNKKRLSRISKSATNLAKRNKTKKSHLH